MELLDMDCVRDLMLWLSRHQKMKNNGRIDPIKMKTVYPQLGQYRQEELYMAATYIFEKGLAVCEGGTDGKTPKHYTFRRITPQGYDFIKAIQDDNVWNRMKSGLKFIATMSVEKIIEVAVGFAIG